MRDGCCGAGGLCGMCCCWVEEVDADQSVAKFCVCVLFEGIEVASDGSREEDGILWYDG